MSAYQELHQIKSFKQMIELILIRYESKNVLYSDFELSQKVFRYRSGWSIELYFDCLRQWW